MSEATPTRPRQVTIAGWLIIVGSVVVVLAVYDQITRLTSLETRETIETFLGEPPGDGLGLETTDVVALLRVTGMVTGACAAAAAVLGWSVLQRSKPARLALAVLAVPLFLGGLVSGGFTSSLVAVAALLLWLQPARDWFDGVTPRQRDDERAAADRAADRAAGRTTPPGGSDGPAPGGWPPAYPPVGSPQDPQDRSAGQTPGPGAEAPAPRSGPQVDGEQGQPAPWTGFGSAAASRPDQQARPDQRVTPYVGHPVPGRPSRRPSAVVWACSLTWAFSGLVALGMVLTAAVIAAAPDMLFDEVYRQNPALADADLSRSDLTTAVYAMAGVVVVWAVVASVVAVLAFRGSNGGRLGLVVSSALAAGLFLVTAVTSLVMALPLAACVATVVLLSRPEVRRWYAERRTAGRARH
ncbi:hypothetical protein [Nocardioides sp. P86]|uniref:hypothetical protein n=1 Tax=Nocardioides sp. P86 TaxID=2939569 RepID=UPI00203C635D|nr:hypothetical protein [Nocardioides sp. P86]MCM3516978.1 hypothetical protein [Nocardioides sp. P86]